MLNDNQSQTLIRMGQRPKSWKRFRISFMEGISHQTDVLEAYSNPILSVRRAAPRNQFFSSTGKSSAVHGPFTRPLVERDVLCISTLIHTVKIMRTRPLVSFKLLACPFTELTYVKRRKGPYLNDVYTIFGILDPPLSTFWQDP